MAEAERNKLSPYRAFYSLTLGGAQAHYLNDRIGNFDPGKEADFVSLDWTAGQKAMVWQTSRLVDKDGPKDIKQAAKLLFSIMSMGDDRSVDETWIMGEPAYKKSAQEQALSASR
jgi:guanine deaminase